MRADPDAQVDEVYVLPYRRVSSDEQAREGFSLPTQRANQLDYVARNATWG